MGFLNQRRDAKAIQRRGSAAHSKSADNERAVVQRLGGKVVPRSGAGIKKGDGQIKGLARLEVKGTIHNSFPVTKKQLAKNDEAALSAGEIPVMIVQFLSPSGAVEDEQAVIRLSDLEELMRRAQCQSQ